MGEHMLRGIIVVGLLLTGSACSHGKTGEVDPAPAPVRVEVTNNYGLPMEIEAVGSGINQRLGVVHPGMVGKFIVPRNLLSSGSVQFQAHPSARGQLFRSGELLLAPGSIADFVISPQLFNSTVTIRP
jgi:hypothetical protein